MNPFLKQIWALVRKNLLILCLRRPFSTFTRAIVIPLVIVLVVAYSKTFFSSPQHWGVSPPQPIRSLKSGLDASHHKIVGFVDNGMKNGDVTSVINALSATVTQNGQTPKLFDNAAELGKSCVSGLDGVSPCYAAVVFLSSPTEGSADSPKGTWNYTLQVENGAFYGFTDVTSNNNGVQVFTLPIQRAVDMAITSQSQGNGVSSLPQTYDIIYTEESEGYRQTQLKSEYLDIVISVFGAIYAFSMIGIVYHLTAFVAKEREMGISSLIDTMVPGSSPARSRLVRQVSTYVSFAAVYFPSWLAIGIVISVVVFPSTSHGLPVGYNILAGFALTSFSLFGSAFFKKAQLSGSIVVVVALVFAILPQVLVKQTKTMNAIFSLLFPTANYTYFIIGMARWEESKKSVDLMQTPPFRPDASNSSLWVIPLYLHWIFLVIQIIVYPVLAFFLEQSLFGTASAGRKLSEPADSRAPTVALTGFCKTYQPSLLGRIFKSKGKVTAVTDLTLKAYRGQILCLLGPNGSGKSTTLNCVAGQEKVTSGSIVIDPTGGLGFAPQGNVFWDDLTVSEHVRIFSDLKSPTTVNNEVVMDLVKACDLQKKASFRAKTLSGGQKRKLQLAMMFAGGSAVCCVDEVSTGLDPISRRRIWEILLAERSRRTIIMTTHFLDEADFIADNIAIMYQGSLKTEGTAATLKNQFGNGYIVILPAQVKFDVRLSGPVEKEESRHRLVYRVANAALAAELIEQLEEAGIHDYQVSGPTMEELFLRVTGDTIQADKESTSEVQDETHHRAALVANAGQSYHLTDGRPLSAFVQWWFLLRKRFRILKRRYVPYFFTIAIAIVGAAVAPSLIKSFNKPMKCPQPADLVEDYSYRSDLSGYAEYSNFVMGPPDRLTDSILDKIASTYSSNHTAYPKYSGFHNGSQLKNQISFVNTYDDFLKAVQGNNQTSATAMSAALWAGDNPTIAFQSQYSYVAGIIHNFLNIVLSGEAISAAVSDFAKTTIPTVYDVRVSEFMIYFGLIMAAYPAFFALYPTNERLYNVRSMQYSNGIRPLPLWLSHLAFDSIFILVISIVAIALLSLSTPVWFGLTPLFFVLLLFGIVSTLLSYIISLFARGPIAAWAFCAIGQTVMYFAYFGALIGVQSSTPYPDLEDVNNKVYFTLALISPIVSLERALAVGLGQFAFLCHGHNAGSLSLYGGPILYLALQAILLFGLLLWWDSSFVLPSLFQRRPRPQDAEATEMNSTDLIAEIARMRSSSTDLRVENVSKSFGKNLAVDDVTFGVQTSEIFALLGPNGAGKSTAISMIRADLKPSTSESIIEVAGHNIRNDAVAARSNLGVCPQFDAADVLTVSETLQFYANIRGVKDIQHNVATVIAACGLEAWSNQLAQKLSGGTKRKLSLAVALVGNPRVLVLDEPSSALDANAKRHMWKCLQTVSKGRAVVLTTHSMEEADALADRIGIVSSRMLAVGERETLKKRAGDAFHIHLVSASAPNTSQQEIDTMKAWISETFAEAKVERDIAGGQVRFQVPAEGNTLVGLIRVLEHSKGEMGVEFYSVGKATLDEVFENIVRRYSPDSGV